MGPRAQCLDHTFAMPAHRPEMQVMTSYAAACSGQHPGPLVCRHLSPSLPTHAYLHAGMHVSISFLQEARRSRVAILLPLLPPRSPPSPSHLPSSEPPLHGAGSLPLPPTLNLSNPCTVVMFITSVALQLEIGVDAQKGLGGRVRSYLPTRLGLPGGSGARDRGGGPRGAAASVLFHTARACTGSMHACRC